MHVSLIEILLCAVQFSLITCCKTCGAYRKEPKDQERDLNDRRICIFMCCPCHFWQFRVQWSLHIIASIAVEKLFICTTLHMEILTVASIKYKLAVLCLQSITSTIFSHGCVSPVKRWSTALFVDHKQHVGKRDILRSRGSHSITYLEDS